MASAPRLELDASIAWKGWARPGRTLEVDLQLKAQSPQQAGVELRSGPATARTRVTLATGQSQRLQLPLPASDKVLVEVTPDQGPPTRLVLSPTLSESPLLGLALADGRSFSLPGFKTVDLSAADLPRRAAAHGAIDALVIDAATLARLAPAQLTALLGHAAACGRIVVLQAQSRLRESLAAAGRCREPSFMLADTLADAEQALRGSLAQPAQPPPADGSVGDLLPPDPALWRLLAALLAVYMALMLLAATITRRWPVFLLLPLSATAGLWLALPAFGPPARLVVWSEAESGSPTARYLARQTVQGSARQALRIQIPPLLGAAVRSCDGVRPLALEYDASGQTATAAQVSTRLFGRSALCFDGSFPVTRSLATSDAGGAAPQLHNPGPAAWPAGRLMAQGQVQVLAPVAAAGTTPVSATAGRAATDAVERLAQARTGLARWGALWPLDLDTVGALPAGARGWLLMTVVEP